MNSKKRVKKVLWFLFALLLALALWAGITPPVSVSASAAGATDFTIDKYDVCYDVGRDRKISVKEKITVYFTGYNSHGIIRDLTIDNGISYRNIRAQCLDSTDFDPTTKYESYDDYEIIAVYLRGDGRTTNQQRTYLLEYDMIVPALKEEGYLPLDVIGFGWQAKIGNVTVQVTLPAEPLQVAVYSGKANTKGNDANVSLTKNGQEITLTVSELGEENGITLDLGFDKGVLTEYDDLTLLWVAIAAALVVAISFVAKFLIGKKIVIPTVNFTAPDDMDPLRMGKLIDNSVDNEDMGALIFYFAEKRYLTIDMSENEDDPILRSTETPLPTDAPNHQKLMYNGLFHGRNEVRVSQLKNSFYQTADAVRKNVYGFTNGMYSKRSIGLILLFCFITFLGTGVFAFLYNGISLGFMLLQPVSLVAPVISLSASCICSVVAEQRRYKWSIGKRLGLRLGGLLVSSLIALFAWWLFTVGFEPIQTLSQIILILAAGLSGLILGYTLDNTDEYHEVLGQIVGFKNFILYTEKDRIQFMLEENPQLYYHILPYAQVLGVTDEWTEKFKGIDIQPPENISYNTGDVLFNCMLYRALFRSFNRTMTASMISRPSSSGSDRIGGGFGGGSGGGFGGGGFGGGGGRGC